MLKTGNNTNKI